MISVKQVVVSVEREAFGSLAIREPTFRTIMHAAPTIGGVKSTQIVKKSFDIYCGAESIPLKSLGASKICSVLVTACDAPYVYTLYSSIEHEKWEHTEKEAGIGEIPSYHSASFYSVLSYFNTKPLLDTHFPGVLIYMAGAH